MLPLNTRNKVTRALTLGAAAVILGVSGCKKKVEPPPPPPAPQAVEVRLQVTSISPSRVDPNVATSGKLFGSAFANGATVAFVGPAGEQAGSEIRVLDANTLELTIPALAQGTYDVRVTNPDGQSSTLRSGLNVQSLQLSCNARTVNFAFDDASLSSSARSALDGVMACYQSEAASIRVEGHCDERGTVDYNLALGQRRADSVKQHLMRAGVAAAKISTTSYGEERPVDRAHNEAAWAKNRRAEISASR